MRTMTVSPPETPGFVSIAVHVSIYVEEQRLSLVIANDLFDLSDLILCTQVSFTQHRQTGSPLRHEQP